MAQKAIYLVAAFLISGCSYSAEVRAYDGPYGGPYGGNYVGSPSYYQPVAYRDSGQPILAEPLYIDGVPVSFQPLDYGVYELVDPDGYVIGYAYVDGVDRLRITDLDGNTLYFLQYDSGGYFRAFNPHGAYLAFFAPTHLVHHFHINRHHFNTPFFHSGSKARKHFRARASKHRRAKLRQRGHHDGRKFSSRGFGDGDRQGHRQHRGKERFDGHKKIHTKGSGWKPVHHSGQAPRRFDASPRGLNTGGAVFGNDFPFQPQAAPQRTSQRKANRGKTKRRAKSGAQAPQAEPQSKPRREANRRQASRSAKRGQQQRQPAVTQAAPARQPQRQTRRAVNAAPPSRPPQAVRTSKSSEPKSQPSRRRAGAERSTPRHNPRTSLGINPRRR